MFFLSSLLDLAAEAIVASDKSAGIASVFSPKRAKSSSSVKLDAKLVVMIPFESRILHNDEIVVDVVVVAVEPKDKARISSLKNGQKAIGSSDEERHFRRGSLDMLLALTA